MNYLKVKMKEKLKIINLGSFSEYIMISLVMYMMLWCRPQVGAVVQQIRKISQPNLLRTSTITGVVLLVVCRDSGVVYVSH